MPGKRVAQILEVSGGHGLPRVVRNVGPGGREIEDRQRVSGLIYNGRVIAAAFRQVGDGVQVCAGNVLAHSLVIQSEIRAAAAVHESWNDYRPGHAEAELVAAKNGLVLSALADLVGYRIEVVVAEELVQAPVPLFFGHGVPAGLLPNAGGAQPQVAGLPLERFYGALDCRLRPRHVLLAFAALMTDIARRRGRRTGSVHVPAAGPEIPNRRLWFLWQAKKFRPRGRLDSTASDFCACIRRIQLSRLGAYGLAPAVQLLPEFGRPLRQLVRPRRTPAA